MPAKTVKDLIDFNNSVPDKFKVKVKIIKTKVYSEASFVDATTGNQLFQHDSKREEYYGTRIGFELEKGSEVGLSRYIDPKNKPTYPWGRASCKENTSKDTYNCHNAWFIGAADAAKGYGPMLYDCLLAKLGEEKLGLISDRSLVSPLAAKVWVEYLTSRPDVRKEPLDFDKSTPQTEDDCYQKHATNTSWNAWINDPEKEEGQDEEEYEKKKEDYRLMRTAVKWAYFDNGITTLKELRDAGLLVEDIYENTNDLKELQKLYESFLKQIKG